MPRLYLPKLSPTPSTILDYLVEHFPRVSREMWIDRMERGVVRTASGRKLSPKSPYAHGLTVTYERESDREPQVPFVERIAYRDERIIVVDKPHFLPVIPGGPYVEQTVIARLQRSTGIAEITPIHRLDRDTAGLVLFVIAPEHRAAYHRLFAEEAVAKEYRAVAHVPEEPREREWTIENRLAAAEPWYRMQIVDGAPNASTRIALERWSDGLGHFRLVPRTGKKHQLRVHMASLGWPIVNDRLYPTVVEPPSEEDDFSAPLQLLAWRLGFTDPMTGERIEVESEQRLIE